MRIKLQPQRTLLFDVGVHFVDPKSLVSSIDKGKRRGEKEEIKKKHLNQMRTKHMLKFVALETTRQQFRPAIILAGG